jgi:hypothetical protein
MASIAWRYSPREGEAVDDLGREAQGGATARKGRSRRAPRGIAVLVIAALLATSVLRPAPAQALDTGETVGVIFGSIAGYILIIFIAAAAVYRHKSHPRQPPPVNDFAPMARDAAHGIAVGPDCPRTSDAMPLVCW